MGILAAGVLLSVAIVGGFWSLRTGATTDTRAAQTAVKPKSIAVLPFADISPDADLEFFADGMTVELITALARITDLRMTGITSSFHFKGRRDLQTVGELLGVEYLLTGLVQRIGDRLRVTAELVNAATGDVPWRKQFDDLPFADVFDVQDEIARRVAGALEVTLGVGASSLPGRTRNVAAYEEWLRAEALWRKYLPQYIDPALKHARHAIELDPSYVPPRYLLYSINRFGGPAFFPARAAEYIRDATAALDEARRLAPGDPLVRVAHALNEMLKGNWMAGGALLNDLPPSAAALGNVPFEGSFLLSVGRVTDAVRAFEEARARDPYNTNVALQLGGAYHVVGLEAAALAERERYLTLGGSEAMARGGRLTAAFEARDRQEIERLLVELRRYPNPSTLMGRFLDRPDAGLAEIRKSIAKPGSLSPLSYVTWANWAAYYGDPELALKLLPGALGVGDPTLVWRPLFRDVRRLPAFKDFARKAGYVEYWRTYGWGDFCRPTTGDDFECVHDVNTGYTRVTRSVPDSSASK